jgi:hypothetical protein
MNLQEYQTITGTTVPTADVTRVTAVINKTQRILESMLGYTLDDTLVDTNQYTELGQTASECPCGDIDLDTLLVADIVVGAYRLFRYDSNDKFLMIDPCEAVNKVKLVKDGITLKTLELDEYRLQTINGITKSLEVCPDCWCNVNSCCCCKCVQLAVDADWLWEDASDIPADLLDVWAEMVTYYANDKKDIKSESLGTHSYSRELTVPENLPNNLAILQKYAGGNGSLSQLKV